MTLIKREMGSDLVVIVSIGTQHMPEMPFAKDHGVVEAFPPDRANETFTMSVPQGNARQLVDPECPSRAISA